MLKIGAMFRCDIAIVRSVDGMTHILLDFMPLGIVILELFPCLLTMIIGNCMGRLLASQHALEPLKELE